MKSVITRMRGDVLARNTMYIQKKLSKLDVSPALNFLKCKNVSN